MVWTKKREEDQRDKLGGWGGVALLACKLAWWTSRSAVYGVNMLFRDWYGRAVLAVLAAVVLIDASTGDDPPVFLGGVSALYLLGGLTVAGAIGYGRRLKWEAAVKDVWYHAVPGHSRTAIEDVRFGWRLGPLHAHTWTNARDFVARVPGAMTGDESAEVEAHLRERLPASEGWSWRFVWDWRRGRCETFLVPDIPAGGVPRAHASPFPERVPIGVGRSGEVFWVMDSNYGCMLVCGQPGGGKSVVLINIVRHCLEHLGSFELYAVDMKGGVELGDLARYPNVRRVSDGLDSSLEVLRLLREEVDRRTPMLRAERVKKIAKLNEVREARGEAPLKRIVLLVDELAELTDVPEVKGSSAAAKDAYEKRSECKELIDSLVRLGRAVGVHLVLSTQRPDAKYMGGATRSNVQARIATGRLNRQGCEMMESQLAGALPGEPGRGVWWRGGTEEEVQFYLVEEEELDTVAFGSQGGSHG